MLDLLQQAKEIVSKQPELNDPYRLNYHITPPYGLLNDPNGFIEYNGTYHLFYQWNPYECNHGSKFWGHCVSTDLVNWQEVKPALTPDTEYEKNGCYSGSAFEHQNSLYLFYTSNVKHANGERDSYQCLAKSEDGIVFEKLGPVISSPPKNYTKHFRDPKIWQHDNLWYCVIGAQYQHDNGDLQGRVLLYYSDDLNNWHCSGDIAGSNVNQLNDFGFMWECPDLFNLNGHDILMCSPQGLEPEADKYQNIYQSGYFVGQLDYQTQKFIHGDFIELDRGFEFYAPQTTLDSKGRRLMSAWMGLPECDDHPTVKYNWLHALTLVRQLIYKDNKLLQQPIEELQTLRKNKTQYQNITLSSETSFTGIEGDSYELIVELSDITQRCGLKLRVSESEYTELYFEPETQCITLDRDYSGAGYGGTRSCILDSKNSLKLQIFMDKSSVEIFVNEGAEVFSSRIYPSQQATGIRFYAHSDCIIDNLIKYTL